MKYDPKTKRLIKTPEDIARHKAIREQFKNKPTIEELVASGELSGHPIPHGIFMDMLMLLHNLRQEREKAGLSLTEVAERSGMDKSTLSKLESGKQTNPTLDTILRYVKALGKEVRWQLVDAGKD
jgi:DNA-binding XRE family transcriptional regulator